MSESVYSRITGEIIAQLEKGTVPWHKPWKNGPEGFPVNLASRKRYRGINSFLLSMQPFQSPYWLTFRQAVALGGSIRKGERATPVVFWKWLEREIETVERGKEKVRIPIIRYYSAFNAEQCERIEYPKPGPVGEVKSIETAERIAAGYPKAPKIEHRGNQALYRPLDDLIQMPERERFDGPEEYYSTLFHELTHSTGHEKRLARHNLAGLCPFGSTNYSKEELVAEMGAAMLSGEAGIENATIANSASYLAGWLNRLKNDHRLIVIAAGQAQHAVDFILGRKYERGEPESV